MPKLRSNVGQRPHRIRAKPNRIFDSKDSVSDKRKDRRSKKVDRRSKRKTKRVKLKVRPVRIKTSRYGRFIETDGKKIYFPSSIGNNNVIKILTREILHKPPTQKVKKRRKRRTKKNTTSDKSDDTQEQIQERKVVGDNVDLSASNLKETIKTSANLDLIKGNKFLQNMFKRLMISKNPQLYHDPTSQFQPPKLAYSNAFNQNNNVVQALAQANLLLSQARRPQIQQPNNRIQQIPALELETKGDEKDGSDTETKGDEKEQKQIELMKLNQPPPRSVLDLPSIEDTLDTLEQSSNRPDGSDTFEQKKSEQKNKPVQEQTERRVKKKKKRDVPLSEEAKAVIASIPQPDAKDRVTITDVTETDEKLSHPQLPFNFNSSIRLTADQEKLYNKWYNVFLYKSRLIRAKKFKEIMAQLFENKFGTETTVITGDSATNVLRKFIIAMTEIGEVKTIKSFDKIMTDFGRKPSTANNKIRMKKRLETLVSKAGSGENEGGLYDYEILDLMKDEPMFRGVICRDEIKNIDNKIPFGGFIMNTCKAKDPVGEHWVACYYDLANEKTVEYYDSFGDPPVKPFNSSMKTHFKIGRLPYMLKYKYNTVPEQDKRTDTCGFHCIRFLKNRFKGKPFSECSGFDKMKKSRVRKMEKNAQGMKKNFEKFGYI